MQLFTKILDDRRGFSLLEMAIVIAIIGLIAGGIVAAQSFIRMSKLTGVVDDAKLYHRAFSQFEDKYHASPGDMSTATSIWTTSGNGNGDGRIFGGVGGAQAEIFLAWQHLQLGGFITGNYSGAAGTAGNIHCVPGTNAPTTTIERVGMQFYDFGTPDYSGASYYTGFYYRPLFIGTQYTTNSICMGVFLTPKEMLSLDSKYDDGLPGLGNIRAMKTDTNCVSGTDPATSTYLTSTTTQQCRMIITGN